MDSAFSSTLSLVTDDAIMDPKYSSERTDQVFTSVTENITLIETTKQTGVTLTHNEKVPYFQINDRIFRAVLTAL